MLENTSFRRQVSPADFQGAFDDVENLTTLLGHAPRSFEVFAQEMCSLARQCPGALRDMTESDLKAIHQLIKSLGPAGEPAPAYVPPDKPRTRPMYSSRRRPHHETHDVQAHGRWYYGGRESIDPSLVRHKLGPQALSHAGYPY